MVIFRSYVSLPEGIMCYKLGSPQASIASGCKAHIFGAWHPPDPSKRGAEEVPSGKRLQKKTMENHPAINGTTRDFTGHVYTYIYIIYIYIYIYNIYIYIYIIYIYIYIWYINLHRPGLFLRSCVPVPAWCELQTEAEVHGKSAARTCTGGHSSLRRIQHLNFWKMYLNMFTEIRGLWKSVR